MKQEFLEQLKQSLIGLENRVEQIDSVQNQALLSAPQWWQDEVAKGPPEWVENACKHFLKVMLPSASINQENVHSLLEDEEAPVGSAHETGLMFGHVKFHVEHLEQLLPGLLAHANTEQMKSLLGLLEQALPELKSAINTVPEQYDSEADKSAYYSAFGEAHKNTLHDASTYKGETQNSKLYLFFLLYWPLITQFDDVTDLHEYCVSAKLYSGDIAAFRKVCSRLKLKLADRGRPSSK